jgi:hypothetical protein
VPPSAPLPAQKQEWQHAGQLPESVAPAVRFAAAAKIAKTASHTGFKKILFKQKTSRGYLFES